MFIARFFETLVVRIALVASFGPIGSELVATAIASHKSSEWEFLGCVNASRCIGLLAKALLDALEHFPCDQGLVFAFGQGHVPRLVFVVARVDFVGESVFDLLRVNFTFAVAGKGRMWFEKALHF